MDQNSLQPREESPVQAATGKTSRLFFIDHLRAALVILVVLHHVARYPGMTGRCRRPQSRGWIRCL